MAERAKGPVILLVILLVAATAGAFLGFIALQKEKETNSLLSEENKELEVRRRSAEKQVTDLKKQVEGLAQEIGQQKAKIQDYDSRIKAMNDELALEKEAKQNALSEASKAKEDAESLRRAKSNSESQLKTAQEELSRLKNQLAAIESMKNEPEEKPKESPVPASGKETESQAQDMRLDKIVVSASGADNTQPQVKKPELNPALTAKAVPPPLEGKVLVVNKEYDFIVVNLGQKDDVNLGDTFSVLRKDKSVAEAKIEEVRDTMSVASPLTKDMIKQIKEDDKVIRK